MSVRHTDRHGINIKMKITARNAIRQTSNCHGISNMLLLADSAMLE